MSLIGQQNGDNDVLPLEQALKYIRDAKRQNSAKGRELTTFITTLDPNSIGAASLVTEKKQVGNRVGEQFDRGANVVVFVALDSEIAANLESEVLKKAYPSLTTVAIFISQNNTFELDRLLVKGDHDIIARFLIAHLNPRVIELPQIEHVKGFDAAGIRKVGVSPLVVDWEASSAAPPPDLLGLDDTFLSASIALREKHIILLGAPGVGKSQLAEYICRTHVGSFKPATATAEWTAGDTIGTYYPDLEGKLDFRPGVILESMLKSKWILIDEINRADIDKAFGEMFSILAGQPVELPYLKLVDGVPKTVVVGSGRDDADSWSVPVDKNWRIVGTMNTADKASLFRLSSAFMRRFAFIEVPIPNEDAFNTIIDGQFDDGDEQMKRCKEHLCAAFSSTATTSLRSTGIEFGPAIIIDFAKFLNGAISQGMSFQEAILRGYAMYILPQLEGRDNLFKGFSAKLAALLGVDNLPDDFIVIARDWLGVIA